MPPDDEPRLHPHLISPRAAQSSPYTNPQGGGGEFRLAAQNRAQHAARLKRQLEDAQAALEERVEDQKAQGIDAGTGITIQFESEANVEMKFESLDVARSGIELLNITTTADGRTLATVFVPEKKLKLFLNKIEAYEQQDTKPNKKGETRPKNEDLVANIRDIRVAALEALWTDTSLPFPGMDQDVTWEVWLRKSDKLSHLDRLKEIADDHDLTISDNAIEFIDRVVVLVHGKGSDLARSNDLLGAIAELRLAKVTADLFVDMNGVERQQWVDDLMDRIDLPDENAPYVCLFDTGLNNGHQLVAPVAHDDDLHTYKPAWGKDDREGHGTQMAGLATYGDLTDVFAGNGQVQLTHKIESVKMFNSADQHEKELYGAVTHESTARVEVIPDRKRVFCMTITATDDRDLGRPSSWSAAVDDITSGRNDGNRRLMIVSAGNTDSSARKNYPDSNMTDGIHDPAQAWNALTVGGYTEKAIVDQVRYPGWQPLAIAGDLAPASCTSTTWPKSPRWPIKPDIVLEAGNMARHDDHEDPDYIDPALDLLTTAHDFNARGPLTTFGDTSGASALAARLAAMAWAKYPNLTPEAVRALLIHSAAWTPAMLRRFTDEHGLVDYENLVRCFGYGVPNFRRLLSSADNALTLIAQDTITPFHKDGNDVKPREMKLHDLPWPQEELANLLDTPVTMKVTLSYFIEPNPGARGWSTKFGYQSHGLRFAVKRAQEGEAAFIRRINKAAREDGYDANPIGETGEWMFPYRSPLRALGSLRSNVWKGTAADLAARGKIAVVPTYGWWNRRPNLEGYIKACHYALIVSITTPETDIYTPVANQINIPIVIEN